MFGTIKAHAQGLGVESSNYIGIATSEPSVLPSIINFVLGALGLLAIPLVIFLPARIVSKRAMSVGKVKIGYWKAFGLLIASSFLAGIIATIITAIMTALVVVNPLFLILGNIVAPIAGTYAFFSLNNRFVGLTKLTFRQKWSIYWPLIIISLLPAIITVAWTVMGTLMMGM